MIIGNIIPAILLELDESVQRSTKWSTGRHREQSRIVDHRLYSDRRGNREWSCRSDAILISHLSVGNSKGSRKTETLSGCVECNRARKLRYPRSTPESFSERFEQCRWNCRFSSMPDWSFAEDLNLYDLEHEKARKVSIWHRRINGFNLLSITFFLSAFHFGQIVSEQRNDRRFFNLEVREKVRKNIHVLFCNCLWDHAIVASNYRYAPVERWPRCRILDEPAIIARTTEMTCWRTTSPRSGFPRRRPSWVGAPFSLRLQRGTRDRIN